jgi:3-oxoacyl-[acyl-carrier-protein] synthase II
MTSAKRRVAITGLGLVTPVGNDVESTWQALLAGRSGGAEISLFDAGGFPVHIASEVKGLRDDAIEDRRLLKHTTRAHRFAWWRPSRPCTTPASAPPMPRPRAGVARSAPA